MFGSGTLWTGRAVVSMGRPASRDSGRVVRSTFWGNLEFGACAVCVVEVVQVSKKVAAGKVCAYMQALS